VRALAIDDAGAVRAEQRIALPPPQRNGAGVEQDPAVWWHACARVLTALAQHIPRDALRAIAIDATSGTVLLSDKRGRPLTPGLMYNDARAESQLARVQAAAPADSIAGTISAGLPKILWLMEHTDLAPVAHILHQADWLSCQLTRRPGYSDSNNCLKSGYDPVARCWPDWLTRLGFPAAWLPAVVPPGQVLGAIDADCAQQLGLPATTLIVSGTTDSTAAILATGARESGDAITSLGSTLVCKVISDTPVFASEFGVYSQPFGERWLVGGGSNAGGAVLRRFFSDAQMQRLSRELDPDHPTGLDYYPLPANGERFPVNDPTLAPRLTPRPDSDAVFFQGLLEGIAQIEYNGYRRLQALGAPYPKTVRSVGGGAHNAAWTRIRARLLQTTMLDVQHSEAAYGSALLARQGYKNRREAKP